MPEVVVGVEAEPEPGRPADAPSARPAPRAWCWATPSAASAPTAAAGVIEGIGSDWVDVELESPVPFTEQNELLVLQIGATEVGLSRHPETSSDQRLVFTLSPQQTAALQDGDEITRPLRRVATRPWSGASVRSTAACCRRSRPR